jgi:hypothetical protein
MRLLGDRVSRRTAWKIACERGWETTYDAEYLASHQAPGRRTGHRQPRIGDEDHGVVPLATVEALTAD